MNKKQICKRTIDFLMIAALPVLMAYMLAGEKLHEWVGTGIFLLFILHHLLNVQWLKNIYHGKYTVIRVVNLILNVLIFIVMLGLMYSGIILFRHVFVNFPVEGSRAFARKIHMLCSYWGFILMSVHLGFHWNMFLGFFRKIQKNIPSVVLIIIAAGISGYGIYAFVKRDIASYMLMKIQFVFFNTEESLFTFILDYLAVMGLFVIVGHYIMRVIKVIEKKRRSI